MTRVGILEEGILVVDIGEFFLKQTNAHLGGVVVIDNEVGALTYDGSDGVN